MSDNLDFDGPDDMFTDARVYFIGGVVIFCVIQLLRWLGAIPW